MQPGGLHVEGSYDLVVGDLEATGSTNAHPAVGQHARLDIRKNATGYDAALTPEFGQSAEMSVALEQDGTVTLSGQAWFSDGSTATDELQTIHLAVGDDGKWSGTFTAEGSEMITNGDTGTESDATATGTVGADARAPQVRASAIVSAPTVVLPWDALEVETSEPVDASALTSALSLTPGSVSWQASPPEVSWLGTTSSFGYRTIWSDFSGNSSLGVAAGLLDPSGNASPSVATPVQFLDVPLAAAFSGSTAPAMWGKATVASSPESCGQAAACFEIGPLDGPCGAEPGGIAGRLVANGSKISITYRLRVASEFSQPQWPSGLGLSLATPGTAAQLASSDLFPTLNATGDPTYGYASDWTTAEIAPQQMGGGEIGFSFVPFGAAQSYCGGELGFVPVTVVVDVAEIKMVP